MDRVTSFAGRLHLDVADGQLAPRKLIDIDQLWWPGNVTVDLHVMYQKPMEYADLFIVQHPQLVIVHAEADGDFFSFSNRMHRHGIEVGLALLPQTGVESIRPALRELDHVLVFSGNLGYQGGSRADFGLLKKVMALKTLKPSLEIGWDGGVNDQNVGDLVRAGVDVLNVGGFIQQATNPAQAYARLESLT
jgi:ribulose-phosphate 3-epimerase